MPSLTDLFNPTFLMFLGILVLVVALLVVYFETKQIFIFIFCFVIWNKLIHKKKCKLLKFRNFKMFLK